MCVVDFLSMSSARSPILFLRFRFFFFFVVSEVLSFMLVVLLVFFFFSGPRSGACSVNGPGLLAKFINKINKYFE